MTYVSVAVEAEEQKPSQPEHPEADTKQVLDLQHWSSLFLAVRLTVVVSFFSIRLLQFSFVFEVSYCSVWTVINFVIRQEHAPRKNGVMPIIWLCYCLSLWTDSTVIYQIKANHWRHLEAVRLIQFLLETVCDKLQLGVNSCQ